MTAPMARGASDEEHVVVQRMARTHGTRKKSSLSRWTMMTARRRLRVRHLSIRRTVVCPPLGSGTDMRLLVASRHPRRSGWQALDMCGPCLHTACDWLLVYFMNIGADTLCFCIQPQNDFESAHVNHTYTAAGGVGRHQMLQSHPWQYCVSYGRHCTVSTTMPIRLLPCRPAAAQPHGEHRLSAAQQQGVSAVAAGPTSQVRTSPCAL
jgi:hypothetical protein